MENTDTPERSASAYTPMSAMRMRSLRLRVEVELEKGIYSPPLRMRPPRPKPTRNSPP